MKAMTEDDSFLYDVEQAWPDFLPVNPHQRDSYSRLLKKGSPLWAGRIRHTRRTPDPAWPTTAGLLCHTPPLPFSPERTGVITGTGTQATMHAPCHSRTLSAPVRGPGGWRPAN